MGRWWGAAFAASLGALMLAPEAGAMGRLAAGAPSTPAMVDLAQGERAVDPNEFRRRQNDRQDAQRQRQADRQRQRQAAQQERQRQRQAERQRERQAAQHERQRQRQAERQAAQQERQRQRQAERQRERQAAQQERQRQRQAERQRERLAAQQERQRQRQAERQAAQQERQRQRQAERQAVQQERQRQRRAERQAAQRERDTLSREELRRLRQAERREFRQDQRERRALARERANEQGRPPIERRDERRLDRLRDRRREARRAERLARREAEREEIRRQNRRAERRAARLRERRQALRREIRRDNRRLDRIENRRARTERLERWERQALREARRERRREARLFADADRQALRDRLILSAAGVSLVISSDADRFRWRAEDVEVFELANGWRERVVRRPNGVTVHTILDADGVPIRRWRVLPDGREVTLFNNLPGWWDEASVVIREPLPVVRERIIIEPSRAPVQAVYDAVVAEPQADLNRTYTLNQILANEGLRAVMPRIDVDTITFATGSAEVPETQIDALEAIGVAIETAVQDDPAEVFLVEGHTDAVGSELSNLELSDRRATSVAQILTEFFEIPPENLVTQGFGEAYLKVATQGASQENRRVTLRRITPLLSTEDRIAGLADEGVPQRIQ